MTLYDLGQAIFRYRRFLFIGLGVLLIVVLALALDFGDGTLQWRGSAKYESGYQISVVAPGTVSLSEPETGDNLDSAASAYADLLSSGEAAQAVGDMTGYRLGEPIVAIVSDDAPIISATVIGPTYDDAVAAALNSFEWLAQKIRQPLNAKPPVVIDPFVPDVRLDEPFTTSMTVDVDESLFSVDNDLFVIIRGGFESGPRQTIVVPVADRAGTSVLGAVAVDPNGSILMNLERADATPYGQLRLVPDPLPDSAKAYPSIEIGLGPAAVDSIVVEDEDTGEATRIWRLNPAAITTQWLPGTPASAAIETTTEQFQIALLTDSPVALQIGGRRGPLLGFAVLIVGLIGLLAAVIIADTWRRDRAMSTASIPAASEKAPQPADDGSAPDTKTAPGRLVIGPAPARTPRESAPSKAADKPEKTTDKPAPARTPRKSAPSKAADKPEKTTDKPAPARTPRESAPSKAADKPEKTTDKPAPARTPRESAPSKAADKPEKTTDKPAPARTPRESAPSKAADKPEKTTDKPEKTGP